MDVGAPEVGLIATAITRGRSLVRRKAIVEAIINTQSLLSGEVKSCVPLLVILPMVVTAPVDGSDQLQFARPPASVIPLILILTVGARSFSLGP